MMRFELFAPILALGVALLPVLALADPAAPAAPADAADFAAAAQLAPSAPPDAPTPPAPTVTTVAPTEATRFEIREFAVDGNTVLPAVLIEQAVYPFLGPGRGLHDIDLARAALEKAYHDAGYLSVTAFIPEQRVTKGLVRLQVIEGSIEKLKVSGNRYSSRSEIRALVPTLAAGEVPNFPRMQEELAGLNRADRRVTPLLRPGKNPGKLEVELTVDDDLPLHANVELNNKQSPNTSALRLEAGLRYDNLFQKQHGFGLNIVKSPQELDEVDVFVANYSLPLSAGRTLSAYLQRSNSHIATPVAGTLVSEGSTSGLRLSLPLPGLAASPGFFHTLSLGADYKRFDDTQDPATLLGDSSLRYAPLVGQYTAGRSNEDGELLGNLILTAGVRPSHERFVDCHGLVREQFECRRSGAQSNFLVMKGDLSLTRRLLGWEYHGRADVQATGAPLIPGEQFLAGGADSVRGYLEGEAAGDIGWRLRTQVSTPSWGGDYALRGLAFFDAAWLKRHDALPGETPQQHLAGSGIGLRATAGKGVQLGLDWAVALVAGPHTERRDQRVHLRLAASI